MSPLVNIETEVNEINDEVATPRIEMLIGVPNIEDIGGTLDVEAQPK